MNLITPEKGFFTRYLVLIILITIVWIAVGSIAGFGRNWNREVISKTF